MSRTVCTEILRRFGYDKAHAVDNPMEVYMRLMGDNTNNEQPAGTELPYREAIGMLMYLVTSTRPYLAFVVGQISRFVSHPNPNMLAGTLHDGITYTRQHYGMMQDNMMTNIAIEGY